MCSFATKNNHHRLESMTMPRLVTAFFYSYLSSSNHFSPSSLISSSSSYVFSSSSHSSSLASSPTYIWRNGIKPQMPITTFQIVINPMIRYLLPPLRIHQILFIDWGVGIVLLSKPSRYFDTINTCSLLVREFDI